MSLKKANVNLTIKALAKKVGNGEVVFDNAIQRKLCWDINKKSLLIHSLISGYPIPPLYSRRGVNEDGKVFYDMLDGKQRSNAIVQFLNDEYKLGDLAEVTLEDGTEVDISGLKFSELAEEIQDEIKDSSLLMYYFEDITEDEVAEMFYRLNNGKPLSAIELTRAKAKSREKIMELGKLPIFNEALTQKQIGGYANEDIIIKSLILLYNDSKSLESKDVRPITAELDIRKEMETTLKNVYDRLVEAHDIILLNDDTPNGRKIAKRVYTRTHMISLVPITKKSIEDNMDIEDFAFWLKSFFNGGQQATISSSYNSVITQGSNKESAVKLRLSELRKDYEAFKINPHLA